jgi:hypothetical protein
MAGPDDGGGPLERVLGGAEDVHAVPVRVGDGEQGLHEVDPAHALGHRVPEQPRGPYHALTVGGHQVESPEHLAQLVALLEARDHRRVQLPCWRVTPVSTAPTAMLTASSIDTGSSGARSKTRLSAGFAAIPPA